MNSNPQLNELKDNLLAQIEHLANQVPEHLKGRMEESIQAAASFGFPGKKNEEWKYSPFRVPTDARFSVRNQSQSLSTVVPALELDKGIVLVFIDGGFVANLSSREFPAGFHLSTASNANWQIAPYENTLFSELNNATHSLQGVHISVDSGVEIENPIVFLHLQENGNAWSQPRIQIEIGEGARASFAECWVNENDELKVINSISEIRVGNGANVSWLNFEKGRRTASHVHQTRVEAGEKSVFQHVVVALGDGYIRNNLEIKIQGEEGDAHMYGLTLGDNELLADHHTFVNHKAENTTSNQLYKGIYSGKSTGIFNGKILVDQVAQKTNAYQSSKNILVSPDAKVNAKPQLEIFADDVKCSHGATIGQLDEEPIFYLRSRGLDLKTARMLLVQAFATEILMKIENNDLRNLVEKEILSAMERMIFN